MVVRAVLVGRIRPLGMAVRAALAAVVGGALVALAACGSGAAGGHDASGASPGPASVPGGRVSAGVVLCRDVPELTSVVVTRTTSLRAFEPSVVLPRGLTVRDRLQVRDLATALCGLPKAPGGSVNCAAQSVGWWRLVFAAGGHPFAPVTVQMSGCQVVRGLGTARIVPAWGFARVFAKDLGLTFPQSASSSGGINP